MVFECLFPHCKAKITLLGMNKEFVGLIYPSDDMHTCLHDSEMFKASKLLGHSDLEGDPVNWVTEKSSAMKSIILKHRKG